LACVWGDDTPRRGAHWEVGGARDCAGVGCTHEGTLLSIHPAVEFNHQLTNRPILHSVPPSPASPTHTGASRATGRRSSPRTNTSTAGARRRTSRTSGATLRRRRRPKPPTTRPSTRTSLRRRRRRRSPLPRRTGQRSPAKAIVSYGLHSVVDYQIAPSITDHTCSRLSSQACQPRVDNRLIGSRSHALPC
jgi:hypothetical protein